jgi:hypothetical protein
LDFSELFRKIKNGKRTAAYRTAHETNEQTNEEKQA